MPPEKTITELYKIQISLTEWFERIGHTNVEELRQEDNTKRDRLALLKKHIELPFDVPTRFTARQVVDRDTLFAEFLATRGQELCAMRLLPQETGLPKLRMRGHSVTQAVSDWFPTQQIDPDKYIIEFMPHPSMHAWSTIFVVNNHGIFGEIIAESHQYLTQGFYTDIKPIVFSFDFKKWTLTPPDNNAEAYLQTMIEYVHVPDHSIQNQLTAEVGAAFSHDYLKGYFETVHSEFGTWFIDYSLRLGELYGDFVAKIGEGGDITGVVGSPGMTRGRARIVTNPKGVRLTEHGILVCDMTSPEYIHLMQQAAAIVTNRGGMLCHAAIIARELKKPCVVGTGNATKILKDDDMIEVDAERGIVRKL